MLPFTTYSIPELPENQTATQGKWLIFITSGPLSATENDLIAKISSALKADFASEAICYEINHSHPISAKTFFNPEVRLVISMGILPAKLGLWIDLQKPGIRFMEMMTFILTATMEELEKNPNAKKELWKNMQMFLAMNAKPNA